jgi:hypothetical protein
MTTANPVPQLSIPEFAATMVRLTALLDRESLLLRAPPGPELDAVQAEKARLTQAYAQASTALRGNAGALDGTAALKQEMKMAAMRLAGAVQRNERMLRAMTDAADRVVAAMVGAIKEQRGGSIGYARPRAFAGHARVAAGVTLDRRL